MYTFKTLVHRRLDNVYAMNSEPTILMALPLGPFYKLLKYIEFAWLNLFVLSQLANPLPVILNVSNFWFLPSP